MDLELLQSIPGTLAFILAASWLAFTIFELVVLWRTAKHIPEQPLTGLESMVGRTARVIAEFRPSSSNEGFHGRVFVRGENWHARWESDEQSPPGIDSMVKIVGVESEPVRMVVK